MSLMPPRPTECPTCDRAYMSFKGHRDVCWEQDSPECKAWRLKHPKREDLTEIERRWLLSALPADVAQLSVDYFTYAYGFLPGPGTIRERVTYRSTPPHYLRCVKVGTGLSRLEVKETLTREDYDKLQLAVTRRLRAERWTIPDYELCKKFQGTFFEAYPFAWEVTRLAYPLPELLLVELEMPSIDIEPEFPAWLAPLVVKEVTDDEAYNAWTLARAD